MAVPNVNQFLPTTVYGSFRNENLGFPGFTALPATAYFKGSLEVDGNCQFDGGSNDFTYSVPTCSIAPTANNMLCNKLYVDTHGGSGVGATGPTGPQGTQGASATIGQYGSFLNLNPQTNPTANSVNKIPFTLDIANGITVVSTTRITISTTGTYQIIFSAEFTKSNASNDQVDMWLMKNGTNLNYTNSSLTISGSNTEFMPTVNFIVSFVAGDYFELAWSSPSTTISLFSQAALTNPVRPNVPSVILTIAQVMNTVAGPTGITGPAGTAGAVGPTGANAVNILPLSNVFTGDSNEFQTEYGSVILHNASIVCDNSVTINRDKFLWFGTRSGPNPGNINYQMTFRGAGYTDMGYYINNQGSKHTFSTTDLTGNDVTNLEIAYNKLSVHTPTTFDILPLVGVQPLATQAYAQSLVLSGPTGPSGTNGTNGTQGATGPTGPAGSGGGGDVTLAGDNIFTGINTFSAVQTKVNRINFTLPNNHIAIFNTYNPDFGLPLQYSTGQSNIIIGTNAGMSLTTGDFNFCGGNSAGLNITTGGQNFCLGYLAGNAITTKSYNFCMGFFAGQNSTGGNNMIMGANAGNNCSSDYNVCIGNNSGSTMSGAGYNTMLGVNTGGQIYAGGFHNTFIGANSDFDVWTNAWNNSSCLGYGCVITKSNQIVLGRASEEVSVAGNFKLNGKFIDGTSSYGTAGQVLSTDGLKTVWINASGGGGDVSLAGNNQFTGNNSFSTLTSVKSLNLGTSDNNVIIATGFGGNSYDSLTSGILNVCIGSSSGTSLTSGSQNLFVGQGTGSYLTTGANNLCFGANAGQNLTTQNSNTFMGQITGWYSSGSLNTAVGVASMLNTKSDFNVGIGFFTLGGSCYGSGNNVGIGYFAGNSIENMSNCTFLGASTGFDNTANSYSNSTALGVNTLITKSNQIVLGTSSEEVYIPGSLVYNTKLDTSQGNSTSTLTLTISNAYKTIPCNPTGAKIILLPNPSTIPNGCWFCINNYSTNISGIIQVKDYTNTSIYATINPTTSINLGGTSIKLATDGSTYYNTI